MIESRTMDAERKKTLALCAAFIAAPRVMFLDQDSAFALRDVMSDAVWKAEVLLDHIDKRWPSGSDANNPTTLRAVAGR
jgi:hypothetical protein